MQAELNIALKYRDALDCSLVMMPPPKDWCSQGKTEEQKKELSDRANTLNAGIKLSYEEKVTHAKKVISHAFEQHNKWYVSYSGGKDSTVLSHLVVFGMGLKLPHAFSNTRMEYPETLKQISKWYGMLKAEGVECYSIFPDVRPNELWKRIGVPLWSKAIAHMYEKFYKSKVDRIPPNVPPKFHADFRALKAAGLKVSGECCNELKKKPLKRWQKLHGLKGAITGVRCDESRARRLAWIIRGSLYKSGSRWIANPLSYWTDADIKRYLTEHGITPIATSGCRGGSGCVTCMFGCHLSDRNSMQELALVNPKMHKAALDDWGYREALDLLNIQYEPDYLF